MANKAAQEKVIKWATTHGAPVRLLVGWNPDDGTWEKDSPVADMLDDIATGAHVTVAARRVTIENIVDLQYQGSTYSEQSEDRDSIPIDQRVFVDLYRSIETAETTAENTLAASVFEKALQDGRLGLEFLSRRWPNRWKEQPITAMDNEDEVRTRVVADIVKDPEAAWALSKVATQIEDRIEAEERAAASDD